MNRFGKILKVSALSLLLFGASLVVFHFWLIAHAKNILSEIVRVQSKGKYRLQVAKITYDYQHLRLELKQPVLTNLDTASTGDKIEMHTQLVVLQLEKLWPLIMSRQLLIDSILMERPVLNLIHQKRSNSQLPKTTFSLSLEMEKLYQSIQSVLTTLKVANFRIDKGAFTLNSASQKNTPPFEIKNIDFYIKGFNIDSTTISQHPNSYTEDIQLRIAGQTIHFPDGSKSIQFSSFRFIANKGNLEVDSCSISGGDNDSTKATFKLFAEKMRIKNVFLAGNDSSDYNRIDSLFFTKPTVSFSLQIKDAQQDSSETIAAAIRKITSATFGRILVRYASINNVDFDIEVERKEKLSTFNFVQDSLVISNLGVGLFPSMPLSAASIRFGVKEFVDYFRDSTYLVHFDSVRINNDQFSLFNINIESTTRVKKGHQKIYIPVLQIQGIDWYQLISQKRLVASNFTLHDPEISILAAGDSKSKPAKKKNDLKHFLKDVFVLKNITVINGSVNYAFSADDYLNIKQINTFLTPDLSNKGLIASLQKTVRNFNTGELVYFKDGWKMTAQSLVYGAHNSLSAASMDLINEAKNVHIKANNVDITGLSDDSKINALDIKKISWENASVIMNLSKKENTATSSTLLIGSLTGGPTELKLVSDQTTINARLSKIRTGGINIDSGKPKELNDLYAEGTAIDITSGNDKFHSGRFSIKDKSASSLSAVTANVALNKQSLRITVPQVNFEADVQRSLSNPFDISWVKILQPVIAVTFNSTTNKAGKDPLPFPKINLGNIEVTDPEVSFQNTNGEAPVHMNLGNSFISATGIKTSADGSQLRLIDMQFQSKNFNLDDNHALHISSPNGMVTIGSKAVILYSGVMAGGRKWALDDGNMDLSNITLLNKRKSGQTDTLQLRSLHAASVFLDDNSLKDPVKYFSDKPKATVSNISFTYRNNKSRINLKGLKGNSSSLSLDSLVYRPQMNRNTFMSSLSFQKDYLTLETGAVFVSDFDINSWLKDSILRIGHLHISNAILNDSRDKHLPLQAGIIKGLPITIIKNFPVKTKIDSISISNSRVRYHEISDKTNQIGNIRFTRLKANIANIKNYDFLPGDSLIVSATGYLMDSAYIQLRMKEAYNDSLATFPIVVKVQPFNMNLLNPFLLPVMSMRIKSGVADSVEIRAIGSDNLSLGEMRFQYHDLKVEFLKAANDQKKTFLTSLITFAANSFVIRTKNSKRIGKIYYERSRNRSFFNYLVRMIASGAASSVGAKRNPKYSRLYEEGVKELKLPAIGY